MLAVEFRRGALFSPEVLRCDLLFISVFVISFCNNRCALFYFMVFFLQNLRMVRGKVASCYVVRVLQQIGIRILRLDSYAHCSRKRRA
jgi:hypothetical protein